MTGKRWNGTAYVDLTTFKRWNGTSWVDLTVGKRWDGASWVDMGLYGSTLSAGVNNTNFFRVIVILHGPTVTRVNTTTAAIVTPTGGTGPYTYVWTKVSGASSIEANSPTSSTTSFGAFVNKDTTLQAVMRCTVSDSLSATAFVDVNVSLTYSSGA